MNVKSACAHGGAIALCCGFTQAIAVPASTICGIIAGISKLSEKIYQKKAAKINTINPTAAQTNAKLKWSSKADSCRKTKEISGLAACSFLLAAVPAGGYMLAFFPWMMYGE